MNLYGILRICCSILGFYERLTLVKLQNSKQNNHQLCKYLDFCEHS